MALNASLNSSTQVSNTNLIKYFPAPTLGSMVWSYFPNQEEADPDAAPVRPKPRPALVVGVAVENGIPYVIVVPGTTKRTSESELYPTEFVIRITDADYLFTGLSHDTKFNFEREIKLPYSSEYFAIPKKKPGSKHVPNDPRLGILPFSYAEPLKQAAKNASEIQNK